MSVLEILQYPDPKLTIKGAEVTDFGEETQRNINNMVDTLYSSKSCIGIAAVQVGIPKQITVIDLSKERNELLVLVNPKLSDPRDETVGPEACMSVAEAGLSGRVKRHKSIYVKAQDRSGKTIKFDADGLLAICIQHEVDHLNGILYLNHLSQLSRSLIERKIKKMKARREKLSNQSKNHSNRSI